MNVHVCVGKIWIELSIQTQEIPDHNGENRTEKAAVGANRL